MSGIHADRGDTSHRLVSGEAVVVGLRVFTNDLERGVITALGWDPDGEGPMHERKATCGWYCDAWHEVTLYADYKGNPITGRRTVMNCERLATSFEGEKP